MPQAPHLRSIANIIETNECFRVAAYQRGFKWGELEVQQLLYDLDLASNAGITYCLQPLVVIRHVAECEIIDGQQRLTTLFLILHYLGHDAFPLSYDTRPGSTRFLLRIADRQITETSCWERHLENRQQDDFLDNVDNFHFFHAYKAIDQWFQKNRPPRSTWLDFLLNQVHFIWHELEETDPETIFLNLNSGRIPLTGTEKIKALFLKAHADADMHGNAIRTPFEIAQEWDQIEHALRDEALWGFLNPPKEYKEAAARIAFVFAVATNCAQSSEESLFQHYAALEQAGTFKASEQWTEVNDCFLILQEWFVDRSSYHKIGFLLAERRLSVKQFWKKSQEAKTKTSFSNFLDGEIRRHIVGTPLDDLRYGGDNDLIRRILLWFNIDTLRGDARFPFDQFNNKEWSLEHIHAQNAEELTGDEKWRVWTAEVLHFMRGLPEGDRPKPLIKRIEESETPERDPKEIMEARMQLMNEVRQLIGSDLETSDLDSIDNLALLDKITNSSLGNSIFPIKRDKIIKADGDGTFIPPATKNVFLKYYGGNVHQMWKWTGEDRDAYLKAIETTYEAAGKPTGQTTS